MRRRDDGKEQNIKRAVIELILQEGFHGTSISKIAKLAGVSPATVYIYYENKEDMLQAIYNEYVEEIFRHMVASIHLEMQGRQLIEMMITSYYNYITDNREVFSFVEQFSHCPSLVDQCMGEQVIYRMSGVISDMKRKGMIKNYSNDNLVALIFSPVKSIASNSYKNRAEKARLLQEFIGLIQDSLLV